MEEIIQVRNLTKFFPGIRALDNVHLTVRTGEVHALIGENGAGKSTLVKILTGVYTPTSGSVKVNGEEVAFRDAIDAQAHGICAIHQEASMFPELTVTENIYMGHHLRSGKSKLIDWKTMKANTKALLDKMQLEINPDTLVKNLSTAQRHMVEVAKALSLDAKVVIMDEPTSALTNREVEDLYRIVNDLKKQGKAIIFISHKFEEIFDVCDYYTVLRDGQYIGEGKIKDTTPEKIINMMIGRDIDTLYPEHKAHPNPEVIFRAEGLSQTGVFNDISFEIRKGEILGFYGLVGAGRTEILRCVFGYDIPTAGKMEYKGKPYAPKHPSEAMAEGMAMVPEDRQKQGLVLQMSIQNNITLPAMKDISGKLFTKSRSEAEYALKYGEEMEIKAAGYHVDADTLSGGNQQKVVLAKWIGTEPELLILDEPTKGIDVATKAAVHEFMVEMADQGKAVVLVSSELPEVLGMSDRVIVMHEGVKTAEFLKKDVTREKIMLAAIGEKV